LLSGLLGQSWDDFLQLGTYQLPSTPGPLPSDPGHTCPKNSIERAVISRLGEHYKPFLNEVANWVVTPGGNIVVLGYPDLIELPKYWPELDQKLGLCLGIGTGDATLLRGWAGDLNATIGQAVSGFDAEPASTRHNVTATFVDVNTGAPHSPSHIAYDNPNLFEPSSGARHNVCASESWLNGISTIDYGAGSFHSKQQGENAMGALAAEVIRRLDWSHLSSPPEWAQYFFPTKPGRTCELVERPLVETVGNDTLTTTANRHLTLEAVKPHPTGFQYTVATQSYVGTTDVGPDAIVQPPTVQNFTLNYVLTPDGTIEAPQQTIAESGIDFRILGFIVYPPANVLQAGGSLTTTVTGEVWSSVPSIESQIRAAVTPGHNSMNFRLGFKVAGIIPRLIKTPAGTFRSVVGLEVSLISVSELDAAPGQPSGSQIASAFRSLSGTTEVWYAKDVGIIQTVTKSLFGTDTLSLQSCS
jgi:hypothetical protein